ncbi:hypothetical protein D3C84_699050 [compost metagenome]
MPVAIGAADQLVLVTHRDIGKTIGTDHNESVVNAIGGKQPGIHPYQRTAGIRPARGVAISAIGANLQLHRLQAPGQIGLTIGLAVTLGIAEVVAHAAARRHRTAVVDPLQVFAVVVTLKAQAQGAAHVERDHPLRLNSPLAVTDLAVGRQVQAAVAPQGLAPAQVEQAGAAVVTGTHIEVASPQAAVALQVQAQGDLLTALAQARVRAVEQ